jgi:hypothetical protein
MGWKEVEEKKRKKERRRRKRGDGWLSCYLHSCTVHHRLHNSVKVLASLKSRLLVRLRLGFVTMITFTVCVCQPHAQPPTWRTRVPLLVWVINLLDLSGKGAPASSNATAGITLRIIWPRKPHHYVKAGIPSVGVQKTITH